MAVYDAVIRKKVSEKLYLGFDVDPDLGAGETISSCVATVTTGLTISVSVTISSTTVKVLASLGTAGADYTIRFVVTTSAGEDLIYDFLVKVVA
jgi:hypothetical protein